VDSLGGGFVFVGGAPRSGTTLVQNILDSHPEVLGGPEFLHLPDIVLLRNRLQSSVDKGWIDLYCSSADVDHEVRMFVERLLRPLADRHGTRVLSEKTPENVLVFPELLALFPAARLVHLVRDPRAVVASLLGVARRARQAGRRPPSKARSLESAVAHTRRCLVAGFASSSRDGDRVLTVRYEDLVAAPVRETRRLCSFIGLDWREEMLQPGRTTHLGEQAITIRSGDMWYDQHSFNEDPNSEHVATWKGVLSGTQLQVISQAFARVPELEALGYDLSTDSLSGLDRVRGMARGRARSLARRLVASPPVEMLRASLALSE
jgi:protein-tyrosine sulfotransferase